MKYCNYRDVTSVHSLNSQNLPGHFSYGLGTRLRKYKTHNGVGCKPEEFVALVMWAPPTTILINYKTPNGVGCKPGEFVALIMWAPPTTVN